MHFRWLACNFGASVGVRCVGSGGANVHCHFVERWRRLQHAGLEFRPDHSGCSEQSRQQHAFVYTAGSGADTIVDFDAWDVGGQDYIDVSGLGIDVGNFASRITIIDTGADTVVRIDSDIFITLKNVSGDGDNVITIDDFILG